MVVLSNAAENPELYYWLVKKYIQVMHAYDSSVIFNKAAVEREMANTFFIEDTDLEGNNVVGFVTCEAHYFNRYPNALEIKEFFIMKSMWRKGYGRRAVAALLEKMRWHEDVCMHILKRNMPAKSFWAAMESTYKWLRWDRPEIPEVPGCDLRVYRPRFNKNNKGKSESNTDTSQNKTESKEE